MIPVAGGPGRKVEIDPELWLKGARGPADESFSLSPHGQSIAFEIGTSADEVWAFENFLPQIRAAK
jgi:hypothetical protein